MIEFTIRNTKTGEVVDGTAAYIDTELSTGPAVDNLMVKFNAAEWKQGQEFKTGDMVVDFDNPREDHPVCVWLRKSENTWRMSGSTELCQDAYVAGLLNNPGYKLVRLKEEDF